MSAAATTRRGAPAAEPRPEFTTPARPLEIPPQLRELGALTEVLVRIDFGGIRGSAVGRAADYRESLEAIMQRQRDGLFTVDEAAQVLADTRHGVDAKRMREKMHKAYRDGKLHIRDAGDLLPKVIVDFHRDEIDLVKVADIDAWLTGDGAGYLFPLVGDGRQYELNGRAAVPAEETIAARRARRLGRLRELGADLRAAGDRWQVTGTRGALAALVREETAARRAMADKTDVRADLAAAMGDIRGS